MLRQKKYNQNEYANNVREVKRFTLEGSNDNSSYTDLTDTFVWNGGSGSGTVGGENTYWRETLWNNDTAYLERKVSLYLKNGQSIQSLVYVIDEGHEQYCRLTIDEQAKIIANAKGGRGPNDEYLYSTRNKIAELGINDAEIECLYTKVRLIKDQKDD